MPLLKERLSGEGKIPKIGILIEKAAEKSRDNGQRAYEPWIKKNGIWFRRRGEIFSPLTENLTLQFLSQEI